ncbi:uncharacterized protein METZ01_LOCUS421204, partial [marine metagenome]
GPGGSFDTHDGPNDSDHDVPK